MNDSHVIRIFSTLKRELVVGRDQRNQKKAHREDVFNLFGLEAFFSLEGGHEFLNCLL